MALFKNNTFAGSTKILASGNNEFSTKNPTPVAKTLFNVSTAGHTIK